MLEFLLNDFQSKYDEAIWGIYYNFSFIFYFLKLLQSFI